MNPVPNDILTPGLGESILDRPHRILAIHIETDELWCIGMPRRQPDGRVVGYLTGPRAFSLATISDALDAGELNQEEFVAPGYWAMSDSDYLNETTQNKEQLRRQARQEKRNVDWAAIEPIIASASLLALVRSRSSLYAAISAQAKAHKRTAGTVYRLLHLYWANGSVRNGLLPATHRCGAPGKQRDQRRRLGRKPYRPDSIEASKDGFILSDRDKRLLAKGYQFINPRRLPRQAYLLTCGAFWAKPGSCESSETVPDLLDPAERPTLKQFRYWGAKLTSAQSKASRLGLRPSPTHHGGSAQNLVAAVGQVAMFDSTSTDVYLTSMLSRLVKLPPMTRSLVVEVRSTVSLGVYCGWDHPSPTTALQAIYCAATNKVELCKRFGIDIGPDDWPGMLMRTYLVDNGELRAASATEAERQIGFGLEFTKSYSGASKGTVETQHRTDHKALDHRVPGTTHGKRRERGEPYPEDEALLNYFEYMHEMLLWIIEYNNQEVAHLAPTEMLKAGVRPTRINLFKWLRDHNQRADLPCDLNQLRALTLPEWKATIQYNGILVKLRDGQRNAPGLRFFCEALREEPRFVQANSNRTVVPVSVRMQPENLAELWLPTSRGLLRVPNVTSDVMLLQEGTITDIATQIAKDTESRREKQATRDQSDFETIVRREEKTANAKRQLKTETRAKGKKVSKTSQRKNLRINAAAEQRIVERVQQDQFLELPTPEPRVDPTLPTSSDNAATAAAMTSFLTTLSTQGQSNG